MTSLDHLPNTAKRAALVAGTAWCARPDRGAGAGQRDPEPADHVSGPPRVSRSRKANFRFTDSQPNVTFRCSLDGARFQSCSSRPGLRRTGGRRHVFLVQARDIIGQLRAPRPGYSWAVDYNAPRLAVSFPANKATYSTARWGPAARTNGAGLCGTVTAPGGLKSVVVWIQQERQSQVLQSVRRFGTTRPSVPSDQGNVCNDLVTADLPDPTASTRCKFGHRCDRDSEASQKTLAS